MKSKKKRLSRWTVRYRLESTDCEEELWFRAENAEHALEQARDYVKDLGPATIGEAKRHKAYIRFDTLVKRYGQPTWHATAAPLQEAIIGDYDNVMFLIQNDIGNGCSGALGFHVVNRFGVCTFPKAFTPEDKDIPYVCGCHW